MSRLSLASAALVVVLSEVLRTSFGRYLAWQLGISVVLGLPAWALARRPQLFGLPPDGWIGAAGLMAGGCQRRTSRSQRARPHPGHPVLGVASLAVHLLSVGVWVGGLGMLLVGGGTAWRALVAHDRARLVRVLVRLFSRVAIVAVLAVVVTGTINALVDLAHLSDLWKITYGKGRAGQDRPAARGPGPRGSATSGACLEHRLPGVHRRSSRSFERSAAVELMAHDGRRWPPPSSPRCAGEVACLAAQGPVNLERRAGGYTMQFFLDPSRLGANEVHVTFVNPQGLAAGDVTNADAVLTPQTGTAQPVAPRLISARPLRR